MKSVIVKILKVTIIEFFIIFYYKALLGEIFMSIYEIIVFALSVIVVIAMFFYNKIDEKNRKRFFIALDVILVISLITMRIMDGEVWYDDFTMQAFLIAYNLFIFFARFRSIFIKIFMIIMLLISLSFSTVFPSSDIPKPTGKYLIGTSKHEIIDTNRNEIYDKSVKNRKFTVQIWYPVDSTAGSKKAYWLYDKKKTARELSRDVKLPYVAFDKLSNIKSNSYINAKLSDREQKYPVIIMSHGWSSQVNLHQDLAEEYASKGYIVVGINHTYGAVSTVFKDGSEKSKNKEALLVGTKDFLKSANVLVNTYAEDIKKTIDYLDILNKSKEFKSRIDKEKIGVIGHSTGGGAAVKEAIFDRRVKALIGEDAWVEPIKKGNIKKGLKIPSMLLRSEQWEKGSNNEKLYLLVKSSKPRPLFYQVDNTTHYDFSMVYMYSPLVKTLGFSGNIDSKKMVKMIRNITVDFFDRELKDKSKKENINFERYSDLVRINIK